VPSSGASEHLAVNLELSTDVHEIELDVRPHVLDVNGGNTREVEGEPRRCRKGPLERCENRVNDGVIAGGQCVFELCCGCRSDRELRWHVCRVTLRNGHLTDNHGSQQHRFTARIAEKTFKTRGRETHMVDRSSKLVFSPAHPETLTLDVNRATIAMPQRALATAHRRLSVIG
jgi:hypothetical protein